MLSSVPHTTRVGGCTPLGAKTADGAVVTEGGTPLPRVPPKAEAAGLPRHAEPPAIEAASGRQLSPVNVSTYGWFCTGNEIDRCLFLETKVEPIAGRIASAP